MSRAEDRYVKLESKTLPDGRVVYKSAIPKVIEGDPVNDLTIVANERDRLDIIANNVFGDPTQWWRIASANGRVNGSLHILPGQTLIIPKG
jgi:nucleoid-associated protein YgaU